MKAKQTLLLTALIFLSLSGFSQKDLINNITYPIFDASQLVPANSSKFINISKDIPIGTAIGLTNYDLQTNYASANRIYNHANGTISAVWTQYQGTNIPDAPERGTGYNYFNGTEWLYTTLSGNETIEGSQRTGWPSIMSNGTEEFVVSHIMTVPTGIFGHYQTTGSTGSNWSSNNIMVGPDAMLWTRAENSGDNYYVIAVDNYETSQTEIDALHFYYSSDAGLTWSYYGEMPNFNSYYHNGQGDNYAIDARDNTVAVVYFGIFGDVLLWKSDDYGTNWSETVINDFPVDAYDLYGGVIIDEDNNLLADTIMSSDGSGSVIIDSNGKVHVTFSVMKYFDEDAVEGTYSYFPYTDGLYYWNEDMGAGAYPGNVTTENFIDLAVSSQVQLIAWSPDLNGNAVLDFVEVGNGNFPFGSYGLSLTSFSNMGIDANDNIFVAFSTVMEGDDYMKPDASPNAQQFRHVWITSYNNTEAFWYAPVCISNNDGINAECVYPSIADQVNNDIHIIHQWDNEPGIKMDEDTDPITDNYIVYKQIPVTEFFSNLPYINSQPVNKLNSCPGSDITISLSGGNIDSYQWQISTDSGNSFSDIPESGAYSNTQTNELGIAVDISFDNNLYRCVLTNAYGSVYSNSVILTIDHEDPTVTCVNDQIIYLTEGQSAYTVSGTEFDPISTNDNCLIETIINDYNNSGTLDGAVFPLNTTFVSWQVTDGVGNEANCSFSVTVNAYVNMKTNKNNRISIYPNPTNTIINLNFSDRSFQKIVLSDLSGKALFEKNIQNETESIDVSSYKPGIYLIKIYSDDGIYIRKIVKL